MITGGLLRIIEYSDDLKGEGGGGIVIFYFFYTKEVN